MIRERIIKLLFELSVNLYKKFLRNTPWEISRHQLKQLPKGSLGAELYSFLHRNHFLLQEKLENHDAIHVLTGIGISVPDEISLQFYLLGNGKRSFYGMLAMLVGILFFPDKFLMFRRQFKAGKAAFPFFQVDFRDLLHQSLKLIRNRYFIQS